MRTMSFWVVGSVLVACGGPPAERGTRDEETSGQEVASASFERRARVALEPSEFATTIVAAADRLEEDHEVDVRRHPAELLTFMRLEPGMRVADLGTGAGYTAELIRRAIGDEGLLFAQNNAYALERFVSESWSARLEREAMSGVVRVDRENDEPLPPEATELNLVSMIFWYHDTVVQGTDRPAMNAAIFRALRPGGVYIVADHSAIPGAGEAAASDYHRLDRALLIEEVEAAGFVLDEEVDFLRDPEDSRDWQVWTRAFATDRFVLRFLKPEA